MYRRTGTIVEWNDERGFGFIRPANGGDRVFCHIESFRGRTLRPARGMACTYELEKAADGRLRAREVRPFGHVPPSQPGAVPAASSRTAAYAGCLVFFAGLGGLVYFQRLPWLALPWYVGLSLLTLVLYGWDKASASGGFRRTPEKTLNTLALAGGWPGGWIAQQGFRHKTRKASFQRAFWTAVALNLLALGLVAYGGPDVWGAKVPAAHQESYQQP
jgi:uncharacterized membrane protein YsdA (DUF1294 family)/cold shock CspA family protein